MRLRGRRQIMAYLGLSVRSGGSWQRVQAKYAQALRRESSGLVWSDTAWIDAQDVGGSTPVCALCQGPSRAQVAGIVVTVARYEPSEGPQTTTRRPGNGRDRTHDGPA